MRMKRILSTACVVAALTAGTQARANGSTFETEGTARVVMPAPGAPAEATIFLDRFDTRLGKLDSVFVTVEAKLDGAWRTENVSQVARKARYGASALLGVDVGARGTLTTFEASASRALTLAAPPPPPFAVSGAPHRIAGALQAGGTRLFAMGASPAWSAAGEAKIPIRVRLDGRVVHGEGLSSALRVAGEVHVRISYHYSAAAGAVLESRASQAAAQPLSARREDALVA